MGRYWRLSWRVFRWLLLGLLALVGLVLACWLFLPDEDVLPEAQQVLQALPQSPPEQNGYFALVGFVASAELDSVQVGRQIVERQRAFVAEKGPIGHGYKDDDLLGANPLSKLPRRLRRCGTHGYAVGPGTCLANLRDQLALAESEAKANAVLLQRYRALYAYPHFENVTAPSASIGMVVPWNDVVYASLLIDAQMAREMAVPSRQAVALAVWRDDVLLWRRIGLQANVMLDRIVAASVLARKLQLASDLLRENPDLARTHAGMMRSITAPLAAEEADLQAALDGEFRLGQAMAKSVFKDGADTWTSASGPLADAMNQVARWSYREGSTTNRYFRQLRGLAEFSRQGGAVMLARQESYLQEQSELNLWSPRHWLYNPIGKILVSVAAPAFHNYGYRLQDLLGFSRMVELQRMLAEAKVPDAEVVDFLRRSSIELPDPYTGRAFRYDASESRIFMDAHGTPPTNKVKSLAVILR